MAGPLWGASSPTLSQAPAASRTRRFHGTVALGDVPAVVFSLRGQHGVVLAIGESGSGFALSSRLSAHQARMLARALIEAAESVDTAQRQPMFTRLEGGAA